MAVDAHDDRAAAARHFEFARRERGLGFLDLALHLLRLLHEFSESGHNVGGLDKRSGCGVIASSG
ncbi:hypothetical protein D3C83_125270 [compost metagenome]